MDIYVYIHMDREKEKIYITYEYIKGGRRGRMQCLSSV